MWDCDEILRKNNSNSEHIKREEAISPRDDGCWSCWNPRLHPFFQRMALIWWRVCVMRMASCPCCHPNKNSFILKSLINSSGGDGSECRPAWGNAQMQNSSKRQSTPQGWRGRETSSGGRCRVMITPQARTNLPELGVRHEPRQTPLCRAWWCKASETMHVPSAWFGCFRCHLDLWAANSHPPCCHGEKAAHHPLLPRPSWIWQEQKVNW